MSNEKNNEGGARRGFASMSEERRKEISSAGGRSAHARGHAHVFTPEEARLAGRRGGSAVSSDRAHMSAIGRIGGTRSRSGKKRLDPTIES
ncbi:hypothetical protein [Dyella sp.]|uniref:hypothetical protein n=1 Tax=Dyella sp. TaxID=1869338 RepID=UPI002D789732|nr:hypothetical protein [Dyella sp.]HET6433078.1 hypothetical protein [Dyella sp.]